MLTGDQLALYQKDMYKVARETYTEEKVMYPEIFKVVNGVKGGGDKFTQLLGAHDIKQHTTENEDIDFHSPVQGWQALVKYHTFSDGVNFSKNAVEDNVKSGEVGRTLKGYAATWGSALRNKKEEYGANILTYGGYTSGDAIYNNTWGSETDSAGALIYDSKPLFNLTGNTRTTKGGGTYYNAISSGSLSPTTFETLYVLVADTNSYSEQDRRIENKPDTLVTKCGADALMAKRICNSDQLPGGQLNDTNVYKGLCKAIDWGYLTGTGWYIGKAKSDLMQWHERQKPVIEFFRRQENRGYRASVDCRWGVLLKPGVWRKWGRTGGSYAATK
jgi:hypothetical protein